MKKINWTHFIIITGIHYILTIVIFWVDTIWAKLFLDLPQPQPIPTGLLVVDWTLILLAMPLLYPFAIIANLMGYNLLDSYKSYYYLIPAFNSSMTAYIALIIHGKIVNRRKTKEYHVD